MIFDFLGDGRSWRFIFKIFCTRSSLHTFGGEFSREASLIFVPKSWQGKRRANLFKFSRQKS